MIIKYPENLCIICGAEIPEGALICPNCGATESTMFEACKPIPIAEPQTEFKVDDTVEQSFREGYTKGFNAGMETACTLKQDNERLKRENAMLRSQIMKRFRTDDMDSFYE